MHKTIERIGTIDPDDPDFMAPIHSAIASAAAEVETAVRADRSWKVAEPLTLTQLPGELFWRVHCTLDTETGDTPILPGDTVPCSAEGCADQVIPGSLNCCGQCYRHYCERHLLLPHTVRGDEPLTLCRGCCDPSAPREPVA